MNIRLLWQQIPSPLISEILAEYNFTGVVLDLEHGVFNLETLFSCIQVITLKKKLAFVRIPPNEKILAQYALDSGCNGLIFSTIETQKQAKSLLEIANFPTNNGKRGLGLVRDNVWGDIELTFKKPLTIAQIETTKGINALQKGALKGFDYYMIGPYDLSLSIGKPGNFESVSFKKNIKKFKNFVEINKRGFHIVKDIKKQLNIYHKWGLLAFSLDTLMIQNEVKELEKL